MSDYTQKNFQEVDNVGADRAPGFEARFARKHLDSEHLGISCFRYPPNFKTPFGHHHREQEEAYVVVEGSGQMRLGDEIVELQAVGRRARRAGRGPRLSRAGPTAWR